MQANFSHTLSAILRGKWLIDKQYAASQLPLIVKMLGKDSLHVSFNENASVDRSGQGMTESPFVVDPITMKRFALYVWNENTYRYIINPNLPANCVAVTPANGPMLKYNGDCGEPGMIKRAAQLMELDSLPQIIGHVLLTDSPGGTVDGTTTLSNAVKNLKKYSIGYVDDGMACSAAMWYISSANEVYASKATDTVGSIGVYTTLFDFLGWFEMNGIKVLDIYAPQSSEKNLEVRKALEGDTSLIIEDLRVIADEFINAIAANRPAAVSSIKTWNTGASFYAKDALKIGLIDGIASFETVIKRVAFKGKQFLKNAA